MGKTQKGKTSKTSRESTEAARTTITSEFLSPPPLDFSTILRDPPSSTVKDAQLEATESEDVRSTYGPITYLEAAVEIADMPPLIWPDSPASSDGDSSVSSSLFRPHYSESTVTIRRGKYRIVHGSSDSAMGEFWSDSCSDDDEALYVENPFVVRAAGAAGSDMQDADAIATAPASTFCVLFYSDETSNCVQCHNVNLYLVCCHVRRAVCTGPRGHSRSQLLPLPHLQRVHLQRQSLFPSIA